jgi:hypothetical protein
MSNERSVESPTREARSYRCPGCSGIVSIPERRRTITLAEVRAVHEETCPGGKLAKAKAAVTDAS